MTNKYITTGILLAAVASHTAGAANLGNSSTVLVPDAAKATLIQALSVGIGKPLTFPDLVIPGDDSLVNTVTVSRISGGGASVAYSANGSPAGPLKTDATANTNGNEAAASLGEIVVSGHQGKAITVTLSAPDADDAKNLADDGYSVVPDALHIDKLESLSASTDGSSGGTYTISFGGTLSASNNATPGTKWEQMKVTVHYR